MKDKVRWLPLLALSLAPALLRAADVAVAVDPALDRHPVSPLIYGVSFGNDTDVASRRWTVRRWGGSSTTRYNWMTDVTNIASDWYFENYPQATVNPATLPNGSTADYFIDATRSASSNVLLTVPIIGWAPKETTHPASALNWGFSIARYGNQCASDIPWYPDAGDGWVMDANCGTWNPTPITGNDPADTSTAVNQSWATAWLAHVLGRVGTAAQGGVRFYALDNEPMLWKGLGCQQCPGDEDRDHRVQLGQRRHAHGRARAGGGPGHFRPRRPGSGHALGGPTLIGGGNRVFPAGGNCGIPPTAMGP